LLIIKMIQMVYKILYEKQNINFIFIKTQILSLSKINYIFIKNQILSL